MAKSERGKKAETEKDTVAAGAPVADGDLARFFIEAMVTDAQFDIYKARYIKTDLKERAERVLLIGLANIGDVIGISAVFNGLREKYPAARIVLLTEAPSGALFERCSEIDRVIEYSREEIAGEYRKQPTPGNLDAACGRFMMLVEVLRAEHFDAVINMHVSARSALIAGALDVPLDAAAGFCVGRDGEMTMRGNVWMQARLLERIPATRTPEENNIRVLGLAPTERKVSVCIPEDEGPWVWRPMIEGEAHALTIGVHAFASTPKREWGEERFIELCRILADERDCSFVVFAGSAERERAGAERICDGIGPRAMTCAGMRLDSTAWAARRCDLFVTNDTGPMHIAGAMGVRCLVIQGPGNLLPYSTIGHIGVAAALSCGGCGPFPECDDQKCFSLIEPRHAAHVARVMLEHGPAGALMKLAGSLDDGAFPHGLITTGTYASLTPRYRMRLRSALPPESNLAAEWTRIAVLNALLLIEAGALETGLHPLGFDHPGLAAPITPKTALREVRRRFEFFECDPANLKKKLEEVLELRGADLTTLTPEAIVITLPILTLESFLRKAGLDAVWPRAESICFGFLEDVCRLMEGN